MAVTLNITVKDR